MKNGQAIRALLFALFLTLGMASKSFAAVSWSVTIAPPALPVYEQPFSPGDDYLWTPGYWGWGGDDYFWVPGTWVLAPQPGLLWTPGYWGWRDGLYVFNEGYWGPTIGFYGGINYGFGYGGRGYDGGRWQNGHFFYNSAVTRVNATVVRNVYAAPVVNVTINHVSFNGGNGGVQVRANAAEMAAGRARHLAPLAVQTQHLEAARGNPELHASRNRGLPPIAATRRAGEFSGNAVVAAKGGAPGHAKDIPAYQAPRGTGAAAPEAREQQMYERQERERQSLQAQQEADHQRFAQAQADEAGRRQMEEQHGRQTQELQARHSQEREQVRQKRRPDEGHG